MNARGLLVVAKQVIPQMRKLEGGNIVIIGATASIKGGANFVPFASAKAAQRSLAQSMARYLDPEKILTFHGIFFSIKRSLNHRFPKAYFPVIDCH